MINWFPLQELHQDWCNLIILPCTKYEPSCGSNNSPCSFESWLDAFAIQFLLWHSYMQMYTGQDMIGGNNLCPIILTREPEGLIYLIMFKYVKVNYSL